MGVSENVLQREEDVFEEVLGMTGRKIKHIFSSQSRYMDVGV